MKRLAVFVGAMLVVAGLLAVNPWWLLVAVGILIINEVA